MSLGFPVIVHTFDSRIIYLYNKKTKPKTMKYIFNTLLLIALLFTFTACSDDDNGGPSTGGGGGSDQQGTASFTVSGDVEGEYTGIADFRAFEMSGIHTWDIGLKDYSPRTFNISFRQFGDEPIDAPSVGNYSLDLSQEEGVYLTSFEHFDSDNPSPGGEYTVGMGETSGVLKITSSTDTRIEGTFSFTASRLEDDGDTS